MKKIVLIFSLILLFKPAFSQNEEENVRMSIVQLFDGMRANDSLMLKAVLSDECSLSTIATTKEGEEQLKKEDIRDFIKAVGTKREGINLDERLSSYTIHVDANLATAWTPYKFFVNDKFSHCGVNSFTLMKQNGTWKIIAIIDTRRKDSCE